MKPSLKNILLALLTITLATSNCNAELREGEVKEPTIHIHPDTKGIISDITFHHKESDVTITYRKDGSLLSTKEKTAYMRYDEKGNLIQAKMDGIELLQTPGKEVMTARFIEVSKKTNVFITITLIKDSQFLKVVYQGTYDGEKIEGDKVIKRGENLVNDRIQKGFKDIVAYSDVAKTLARDVMMNEAGIDINNP